jgi:flagellar biosynthesis protein FlhB
MISRFWQIFLMNKLKEIGSFLMKCLSVILITVIGLSIFIGGCAFIIWISSLLPTSVKHFLKFLLMIGLCIFLISAVVAAIINFVYIFVNWIKDNLALAEIQLERELKAKEKCLK